MVDIPGSAQPPEEKPPAVAPEQPAVQPEQPPVQDQPDTPYYLKSDTALAQDPTEQIKTAAKLNLRTDMVRDQPLFVQDTIKENNVDKQSELTKQTLRELNYSHDTAFADPEMWNDLTSAASALGTTDKLEDEKAEILQGQMLDPAKVEDTGRQMRLAEINVALKNMREQRSGVENVAFDIGKVLYDMTDYAETGVKVGAAGAGVGAVVGAATAGPLGAAGLGAAGWTAGFSRGFYGHMIWDAYNKSSTGLFEALGEYRDKDGNPLDPKSRANLAAGAGAVVSALNFIGHFPIIKDTGIGRMLNGAAITRLVSEAENQPMRNALTTLGKSLATNAGAQAAISYVPKIAEAFAKAKVENGSFTNEFWNTIANLGNLKDAAYGAAVNTAAMVPLSAVSFKGSVAAEREAMVTDRAGEFQRMRSEGVPLNEIPQEYHPNGTQADLEANRAGIAYDADVAEVQRRMSQKLLNAKQDIAFGDRINAVTDLFKKTPMLQDLSVRERVGATILRVAGVNDLYIDAVRAKQLLPDIKDQLIRQKVEDALKISGSDKTEAPVKVSAIDFLNMAHSEPLLKETFLESPSSETMQSASDVFKKVQDVATKFKGAKDMNALEMIKDVVFTEHVNGSSYGDVYNYHDFLKRENVIPEELWKTFTQKEQDELNSILNPAKVQVMKDLNLDRKEVKDSLLNIVRRRAIQEEAVRNAKLIEADPNRQNVDNYYRSRKQDIGLLWRIDPSTISPELRKQFETNPRLKQLRVFDIKNGTDATYVMRELGFNSHKEMLETLSTARTTAELEKLALDSGKLAIDGQIADVAKRFDDAAHQAKQLSDSQTIMRQVAEKSLELINKKIEGSVEKKVIFRLPKNEHIDYMVTETVENNSIGNLGGEDTYFRMVKKHQMAAWKYMRDGDYGKAVQAWTSALYANRMGIEVRLARRKMFKLTDLISKMDSEESNHMFQQAGGTTEAAAKQVLEMFTKPNAEWDKVTKYVRDQKSKGNYVPPIAVKKFNEVVDLAAMSGGEVRDTLQLVSNLYKTAELKSEIVMKRKNEEVRLNSENDVNEALTNMGETRPDKAKLKIGKNIPLGKAIADNYVTGSTKVIELAHLVDGYKEGSIGKLVKNIHVQYDMATLAKNNLAAKIELIKSDFDKVAGKGAFEKMSTNVLNIPELASSDHLRNGKLTERELFGLAAHLGNESSRKRIGNFVVEDYGKTKIMLSANDAQKIVEKYLTKSHMDAVQKLWDIYDLFKQPIIDTNKAIHGFSDTAFIPPREVEMFGHIYKGGYFPALAEMKGTTTFLERMWGRFSKRPSVGEVQFKYEGIEDFTNTDRLKERTDSPAPLSLDPEVFVKSYSQLIHDIHMRPILDYAAKVFGDPRLLKRMNEFFGNQNDVKEFNNFAQHIGDPSYEKKYNALQSAMIAVNKAAVVGTIALRPLSIIAQHFSQFLVPTQLKDKGSYLPEVTREYGTLVSDPLQYRERLAFFAKHDPQLTISFNEMMDLDRKAHTMFEKVHSEHTSINWLLATREAMMDKTMASLKHSDTIAQIVTRSTLYRMGREGKLIGEGIQPHDEQAILDFAKNVSERTITSNSLMALTDYQRNPATKLFLMTYMSGLNLSFNVVRVNYNRILDGYSTMRRSEESVDPEAFRLKGKEMAKDGFHNLGYVALATSFIPAITQSLYNLGKKNNDSPEEFAKNTAKDAVTNLASPFPFASGAAFMLANQWTTNMVPVQQQFEMFGHMAQWYLNLMMFKMSHPMNDKKFKDAAKGTMALAGMPANETWAVMLSPEARKAWSHGARATVGSIIGAYEALKSDPGFETLSPQEKEAYDYYMNRLQQLKTGSTQPLKEINEALKNDPNIKSGFIDAPIPGSNIPEAAPPEQKDIKPLTQEEKVGVQDWFKGLFKNEPTAPTEENMTPIQQDAPAEDQAPPVNDDLIPSAGSSVADSKQLENVAKLYAKAGLDTTGMSKSAFTEYTKIKDRYLEVLNDSALSDQNKLLRLSALVIGSGESFKGVAYDDKQPNKVLSKGDKIKGVLSIGYGFTKDVKIGDTMTEDQGAERLMTELESRINILNAAEKKHGLDLNINQEVALISTIYNGGWQPDKFKNSTAAIKKGFFEPLLANTLESSSQTNIDGLLKRRLLEYLIFNVAPPVSKNVNKNNLTAKLNTQDTVIR